VIVTGSIPKRVIDADDYDALLAATGFAVKIRWQSTVNIGATAYKYTLWLELLNAQYMDGGPEALANKRRHGGSFNWKATYAGAAGSRSGPSSTRPRATPDGRLTLADALGARGRAPRRARLHDRPATRSR
jgi:hypothetical protein